MSAIDSAVRKIRLNQGSDLEHYVSAFPAHLNLRTKIVKGSSGGAADKAEYVGLAPPGALLTDKRWQIKKLIYDSTGFQTDVLFADGSIEFDKVFDDGSSNYANFTYTTT